VAGGTYGFGRFRPAVTELAGAAQPSESMPSTRTNNLDRQVAGRPGVRNLTQLGYTAANAQDRVARFRAGLTEVELWA